MTKAEYNGWTNYETWDVALWMDNDQASQEFWSEQASQALEMAKDTSSVNARLTGTEPFTVEQRAVLSLSETIKEYYETQAADMLAAAGSSASFLADLLNAALSEVNWHEIAEHLVDAAKEAV